MSSSSQWTIEEDKSFEKAIALHWNDKDDDEDNNSDEQWNLIASKVPTKTIEELKKHLNDLISDVHAIEAGHIDLPKYETGASSQNDYRSFSGAGPSDKRPNCSFTNGFSGLGHESTAQGSKGGSRAEQERRKGIPWTEEEHRLFLLGLDKFGKGDWRSISRNFVMSRSPTQVASHAQKYFIRLNSMNRDRRRSSIHDITSVNGSGGDVTSPQPPITGQQVNTGPTMAHPVGPLVKHRAQPNMPAMGMYRMPMGHPIGAPGHMGSAVGTPVMLPPGHHHPPYVIPMVYPSVPPPMHQ